MPRFYDATGFSQSAFHFPGEGCDFYRFHKTPLLENIKGRLCYVIPILFNQSVVISGFCLSASGLISFRADLDPLIADKKSFHTGIVAVNLEFII